MSARHTRLYDMLAVNADVNSVDLDQAFRSLAARLLRSEQTPETHRELAAINAAFAILRNPRKRRTYDWLGEDAVTFFHDSRDLCLIDLVAKATTLLASYQYMGFIPIVILNLSLFHVLLANVCMKLDLASELSWANLLWPLWTLDGQCLLVAVVLLFKRHSMIGSEGSNTCRDAGGLQLWTVLIVVLGFQILVVMALEGEMPPRTTQLVLLPYYIGEGLCLLRATCLHRFYVVARHSVLRLAQALLVAFKLDKTLDISWWLVFSPFLSLFVVQSSVGLVKWCRLVRSRRVRLGYDTVPVDATPVHGEEEDQSGPSPYIVVAVVFIRLAVYSPLVVLAYCLQSGAEVAYSHVFILWFVVRPIFLHHDDGEYSTVCSSLSTCFYGAPSST
ncbi:Aste57867_11603 [Aphanomyces stellatus]|uniref:Aste57867_11603 protein n=1 Tax=Aphanomyces stellatus TaxID=120398 RepID=A0A485KTT1_9STRA|nr:hypothetical protein As57867_011560 [Aphanomyces stellatus]VFT88461.1 Aste57867_11603 [Aphanomyces stellatus]